MPKFRKIYEKVSENIKLDRWLLFLQQDTSEEKLKELMEMDLGIKMAEEKLERLSSDPDTIALYRAREDAAHERANLISTGIERGIEQGIQEGIRQSREQMAVNLLDLLDDEVISQKTNLPLERVKALREQYEK